jgi:hypothetical protein
LLHKRAPPHQEKGSGKLPDLDFNLYFLERETI